MSRTSRPGAPDAAASGLVVCCDFDGTITAEDLGVATLRAFAREGWWELEQRWRRREISTTQCMPAQFDLVDADTPALAEFYATAEVDAHFLAFCNACRERAIPVVILSDGIDFYVRPVLARLGLADLPVYVNHGERSAEGFRFAFPYCRPDCGQCGNCKRAHINRLRQAHGRVVFIGDGYSDRCAAAKADVVFAKQTLADHCRDEGIPFRRFDSFADILAELPRLVESLGR